MRWVTVYRSCTNLMELAQKTDYTAGASLPASIIIGKKENGQYYVDSDKQWDVENVLSEFVWTSLGSPAELKLSRVLFWRRCSRRRKRTSLVI